VPNTPAEEANKIVNEETPTNKYLANLFRKNGCLYICGFMLYHVYYYKINYLSRGSIVNN